MSNAADEVDRASGRDTRRTAAESGSPSDAQAEDRLDERLRAVERALTGTDAAVADLGDDAAAAAEREALESRVTELESRVEELEAATQAIRGYVGSIRAVNREVERRADLALARASRGGDADPDIESPVEADRGDTPPDRGAPDDAVPSETALDAAVPADAVGRTDPGASTGPGADGGGDDGDETDGSWRGEALERLRESL